MAKTILTTAGQPTATIANTIQYWPLAVASRENPSTVETEKQILHRTPGIISKLYVRVTANTVNGNSGVDIRKNGISVMSITIGPNATGVFENTVDNVMVAAGDKLAYQTVPGAATGSLTIPIFSVLFEASVATDTITRLANTGPALNYTTASVSRYNGVAGHHSSGTGSEIQNKSKIRKAATGKNLAIYVSANARTTDTLVRTRKNAANGACLITIPPGGTGWFEDTTNSDTLAVGDDYAIVVVTGTGTEIMTVQSTSIDLVTTSQWGSTFNGRTATFTLNAGSIQYFPIGGGLNTGTAEISARQKTRMPVQFSELVVHVVTNTLTADSIVKVRKNGLDTSMSATVTAGATGYFIDSSNTETFSDTDDISFQMIAGATGTSMLLRSISLSLSETVAPVIGTGGGSQGRSPLYRTRSRRREPEIAIAIVRVRIPLEYEVEKLSVQVLLLLPVPEKRLIKYASAILTPLARILPLPIRPTPPPPVQKIVRVSIPLTYEVTNLQLKAACSYQVDRLFTQKEQHKIVATSINFLLSDFI